MVAPRILAFSSNLGQLRRVSRCFCLSRIRDSACDREAQPSGVALNRYAPLAPERHFLMGLSDGHSYNAVSRGSLLRAQERESAMTGTTNNLMDQIKTKSSGTTNFEMSLMVNT